MGAILHVCFVGHLTSQIPGSPLVVSACLITVLGKGCPFAFAFSSRSRVCHDRESRRPSLSRLCFCAPQNLDMHTYTHFIEELSQAGQHSRRHSTTHHRPSVVSSGASGSTLLKPRYCRVTMRCRLGWYSSPKSAATSNYPSCDPANSSCALPRRRKRVRASGLVTCAHLLGHV